MALANFTLTTIGAATPAIAHTSATPLRVDLDDLLYAPEDHQPNAPETSNEPFTPPTRRPKLRKRAGTAYLPPPNQYARYPQTNIPHNPYNLHTQVYQQNTRLDIQIENQRVHEVNTQFDNTGRYVHDPTGDYDYEQRRLNQNPQTVGYSPGYADTPYTPLTTPSPSSRQFPNQNVNNFNFVNRATAPSPPRTNEVPKSSSGQSGPSEQSDQSGQTPPDRPRGFTKVESGGSGGKTQLHAVLDYDDADDYYDEVPGTDSGPAVTPLQGPILLRNGSVPVVPLTAYRTVNNGSFYQIPLWMQYIYGRTWRKSYCYFGLLHFHHPEDTCRDSILWTALSLALGYELQGQIIRGVPCVKRNYQLYCPTAGNTYPLDKIETFIDENKALIKRMYGSFTTPGGNRVRRAPGVPDMHDASGDSYFRHVRQASNTQLPDPQAINSTGRIDACESKTEIMTPYWALNSARKLRAIVNTMHFEQAIHQEVCSKKTTSRCTRDCGCEQKYKWHRLLAYDPSDDCAGIFMDWFLFPSCCVCRCNP